ncbi:hypothetical protein [Pseudalkalibacillus berkeleyi]|uniref:Uncharacterized protein n=1 Tax=Pseudalkalibacillus berkeleyi TaxID=1069813 RepID=A0ABS9GX36_9BACL|nr:hypothetical protein [Pseudalkalibacillus berkeleyi]MCF6137344.1 hypothetical protein [Pseudalkalibacillus berkeleyi]
MELYRIFYTYRTRDLNFITITGMDMTNRKLFSVLIYSPNDTIDLDHPLTPSLPEHLRTLLQNEASKINVGHYDLSSWETNVLH